MDNISKQQTGFKFGQHRLTVTKRHGQVTYNGRAYKLVSVTTHDGLPYYSLRLYNAQGKFIKQLLMEPEIFEDITALMSAELYGPEHEDETILSR